MDNVVSGRSLAFTGAAAPPDEQRIHVLLPELDLIGSEELRGVVARIWAHAWRLSDWADPADAFMTISSLPAERDAYAERWNQIEHTRAVIAAAAAMLPGLERHVGFTVDRDTLFAGALLHDVAKLVEFGPGAGDGPRKTPVGAVLHHASIGAQWAIEAGLAPAIAHVVVAHSPSTSAVPETHEALVVKLADQVVTDLNRLTTEQESEQPPKARSERHERK